MAVQTIRFLKTDSTDETAQREPDVVDETSFVRLGAGWSGPVRDGDTVHRVGADGSELLADPPDEFIHVVMLDLEPVEPGKPVTVEVDAADDASVVTMNVFARQLLRIVLPGSRTDIHTLRLRLKSTKGDTEDPRIKLYGVTLARLFGDVVVAHNGLLLGDGWYESEIFDAEGFRWVRNDAEIILGDDFSGERLVIDLAPGPAMPELPMRLQVLDEHAHELARADIAERTRLLIALSPGQTYALRLHVENGGKYASGQDPRVLNFRVFQVTVLDKPLS